jgi:hypothetical protein
VSEAAKSKDIGERVKHSGEIHFYGWDWEYGRLDDQISETVAGFLTAAFKDFPPRLSLPNVYDKNDGRRGPAVDVLTLYVQLDAIGEDCAGPEWSFNLWDVFLEELSPHEEYNGGLSDEGRAFAARFRDGLRAMADKIDAIIAP